MILNKKLFDEQGYYLIKNAIEPTLLAHTRYRAIELKENKMHLEGQPREWGTGTYWKGIEMASKLDNELFNCYTHKSMYGIVSTLLGTKTPYLFNDQVVVKMPREDFAFGEHFDNQHGPDPIGALNNEFKTINFLWALTDAPKKSGPLEILNKKTNQWDLITAKAGDIIAIDGNTYHRSENNNTSKVRAMYACVYANKKMNFDGFYNEKWDLEKSLVFINKWQD